MTDSHLVCIKDPTETSRFIYDNTPGAPTELCAISFRLFQWVELELSVQLPTESH